MKHIPGYENIYAIDRGGSVWRIGAPRERPLVPVLVNGYHRVTLCAGNVKKPCFVHQLVLLAYVGPRPAGKEPCHRNDIKTDNRLSNLYWGTRAENIADKQRNGRQVRGEQHGQAKLTEEQVREIRQALGASMDTLALDYGVSRSAIEAVRYRANWKHIE